MVKKGRETETERETTYSILFFLKKGKGEGRKGEKKIFFC